MCVREELSEKNSEGINVGALIESLALSLLRRHICRSARRGVTLGSLPDVPNGIPLWGRRVVVRDLSQAEVQ